MTRRDSDPAVMLGCALWMTCWTLGLMTVACVALWWTAH